jgi:hypothetical protein
MVQHLQFNTILQKYKFVFAIFRQKLFCVQRTFRLSKKQKSPGKAFPEHFLVKSNGSKNSVCRNDFDTTLFFVELHGSVAESEEGVIPTATDIVAGTETGATLTNDDGTGGNGFAAKSLDAEVLRITVAAVTAAGLTFFMCHDFNSFYQ